MINWNTDTSQLKKNPQKYTLWELTQGINYGLDGKKLDKEELKRVWPYIKNQLDPYKKRALEYLLWGTLYSLPTNLTFWNVSKKNRS